MACTLAKKTTKNNTILFQRQLLTRHKTLLTRSPATTGRPIYSFNTVTMQLQQVYSKRHF